MPRNTAGLKRGGQPGRKKGSKNKATVEVKEMARRLIEDPAYQAQLRERLLKGTLPGNMEALLWAYGYGKPRDTVDLNVSAERKTLIIVPHLNVPQPEEEKSLTTEAASTLTLRAEPPLRFTAPTNETKTYGPPAWPGKNPRW